MDHIGNNSSTSTPDRLSLPSLEDEFYIKTHVWGSLWEKYYKLSSYIVDQCWIPRYLILVTVAPPLSSIAGDKL